MIAPNMEQSEYRASEGINVSGYRYTWEQDGEAIKANIEADVDVTEVMDFGTLVHAAILEPDTLDDLYCVWEGGDKRKNAGAWKAFKRDNSDKIVTTPERLEGLALIGERTKRNSEAMMLLNGSDSEVSLFWDVDCGAKCKGRLDVVQPKSHIIADVKTTGKIAFRGFSRFAMDTGLHIQAGHYAEGYRRCYGIDHNPTFWFICIENKAPYRIACRPLSDELLEFGRQRNKELVSKIHIGNVTGAWSTLADEEGIQEMQLPEYYKDGNEKDISTGTMEVSEL